MVGSHSNGFTYRRLTIRMEPSFTERNMAREGLPFEWQPSHSNEPYKQRLTIRMVAQPFEQSLIYTNKYKYIQRLPRHENERNFCRKQKYAIPEMNLGVKQTPFRNIKGSRDCLARKIKEIKKKYYNRRRKITVIDIYIHIQIDLQSE